MEAAISNDAPKLTRWIMEQEQADKKREMAREAAENAKALTEQANEVLVTISPQEPPQVVEQSATEITPIVSPVADTPDSLLSNLWSLNLPFLSGIL